MAYLPVGWVRMDHPDTVGTAVATQEAFDALWGSLGWVIIETNPPTTPDNIQIHTLTAETVGDLPSPVGLEGRVALVGTGGSLVGYESDDVSWVALVVGGTSIPSGPAGGILGGVYPDPDLSADALNLLPPTRKSSFPHRAATMFLAHGSAQLVKELWIGDSTSAYGSSSPGVTDMVSIYEATMARAFNSVPRGSGYVCMDQWTAVGGSVIKWDTVPAGQHTTRGPSNSNKTILAAQSAVHSGQGSGVTIFYTAYRTGGAVVDVTINGTVVGTIDNRDGTIAAGVDFDSGRTAFFARPVVSTMVATMEVTLAHNGTGTTFEGEGAYFHGLNVATGHQVIRADISGQSLDYVSDATTGDPLMQVIANIQPHIITIVLGVNDAQPLGLDHTAAVTAADLTTLITNIRAAYTGGWAGVAVRIPQLPAIRYVFQSKSAWVPATWLTDYRTALREVCSANDVLFIDGSDAVGAITGFVADSGDPLDISNDTLHPNDYGHRAFGQMMADVTVRATNTRQVPFLLNSTSKQAVTSALGALTLVSASGVGLTVARDTGAATVSGAQLGYYAFMGAFDAFGNLNYGAAIRSTAEANFGAADSSARLEFMTTPAGVLGGILVRGGISGTGTFYIGTTLAAAVAQISAAGAMGLAAGLVVGNAPATAAVGQVDAYAFAAIAQLLLYRAQGVVGAPTGVTIGQAIGRLAFKGYHSGGGYTGNIAHITVTANETLSATGRGTHMGFWVTSDGTTVATERMRQYGTPDTLSIASQVMVGNTGLGTVASVGSGLDVVSGLFQTRRSAMALVNGNNLAVALPATSVAFVSGPTGAFTVQTLAGQATGFQMWIVNLTGQNMTILHDDGATGTAAQRITSLTGASQTTVGNGMAHLIYDSGTSRWILLELLP